MANKENKMDQYFREKLSYHEENPSQLVWERLDRQLSGKKPAFSPILKVAATILIIIGFGFIIWRISISENTSSIHLAEQREVALLKEIEKNILNQEHSEIKSIEIREEEVQEPSTGKDPDREKIVQIQKQNPVKKSSEPISNLLAQDAPDIEKTRIDESLPQVSEISLPELKLNEGIALGIEPEEKEAFQEETVNYRIIIKSKGLKDEPKKQNIIEGIENNVYKIGAFLGKVEQGFADLQDAKENLFASNTPRKERSK